MLQKRWIWNLFNKNQAAAPQQARKHRRQLSFEPLEDRSIPAVLTVNSLLDGAVNFTDDVVTLREAVQAANNDVQVSSNGQTGNGSDTIQFANGLRGGTITLTQGELRVTESLTIQGLGSGNLTLGGGNSSRLFTLGGNGANAYTFNDITLANGNGQGANERRGGGAIQLFGDRDDVLNITRSVLRNHQTNNRVGAAVSLVFGTLNVTDSAIVNNGSGQGTIYLQDATGNFTSSTLSGNQSGFGSVWARSGFGTANLSLTNVTVANNSVGIFYSSERVNAATNVSYRNSIFSGNGASFQVGGAQGTITLTSQGNNILSDATGDPTPQSTDRLNTDAGITPLTQVNGTFVHQILPGSSAIDAADGNAPASDQLGIARRDGDLNGSVIADIGATESTAFVVTTAQDVVNSNDGLLSLREAITLANAAGGADTIFFDNGLSGGTITLTQGELRVTESLTIQGLGSGNLTLSGGNTTRLFNLGGRGANEYTFNDITLANGNGQGANERRGGGAIQLFGDRDDVLNINRSVLRNHRTNNRVGAAVSLVFGTLNVTDSAIVNNGSGQGTIYLQDATGNFASSTLSGNQSSFGSVWARSGFGTANLSLTNVTVANNSVGIFYSSERVNAATSVSYRNSLFSGNGASFQVGGAQGTITLTSQGNNLLSDATGDATPQSTDRLNTDAGITPLTQVNGTFVHQLLPGSIAIDAGNNAFAPAQDQRGQSRVDGEGNGTITSDIGAFEFTNVAPVLNAQSLSVNENETVVGTVIATDADLPNDTLTFRIAGTGADDDLFSISSGGVLSFITAPDFENAIDQGGIAGDNVYEVAVLVQDGTGASSIAILTVTVNPVNDNAPVFLSGRSVHVEEGSAVVQTLAATDADLPAQAITFSITGGADASRFRIINGNQLQFVLPPDFNRPADTNGDNVYLVEVEANDGNGRASRQVIRVEVTGDLFAPPLTESGDGGVSLSNVEAANRLFSTLSSQGNPGNGFSNGATGESSPTVDVAFSEDPDEEAPTLSSALSDASFLEGGSAPEAVALSGAFTDGDVEDEHTLVIDWGDGSELVLALEPDSRSFEVPHHYAEDGAYTIQVTVIDRNGESDTRQATVEVQEGQLHAEAMAGSGMASVAIPSGEPGKSAENGTSSPKIRLLEARTEAGEEAAPMVSSEAEVNLPAQ